MQVLDHVHAICSAFTVPKLCSSGTEQEKQTKSKQVRRKTLARATPVHQRYQRPTNIHAWGRHHACYEDGACADLSA